MTRPWVTREESGGHVGTAPIARSARYMPLKVARQQPVDANDALMPA